MELQPIEDIVRNIDARLGKVEQILPTLATKTELAAAIAPLATREEMHAAIAAAVAPLATRDEMRVEIREEGARTRQHFDAVAERLEGQIRLVAEGVAHGYERIETVRTELKGDIAMLDGRVTRLEAERLK